MTARSSRIFVLLFAKNKNGGTKARKLGLAKTLWMCGCPPPVGPTDWMCIPHMLSAKFFVGGGQVESSVTKIKFHMLN